MRPQFIELHEELRIELHAAFRLGLELHHPEAFTNNLSITTLRYVPLELRTRVGSEQTEAYLNRLNQLLLTYVESSGEAFCSNALIEGKWALRFCIVNFRTSTDDIEAMPLLVARLGGQAHAELSSQ